MLLELLLSISIQEYLRIFAEIAILSFVLYRLYSAIAETKATQLLGICLGIVLIFGVSYVLKLDVILKLLDILLVPILMMVVVFFHPELRRAFSSSNSFSRKRFFRMGSQSTGDQIDSILNACTVLVEKKRGALIVFPRHTDIKDVVNSGTKLNADLSTTLLLTIFDHDTPLHDGACIVQGGKITYAACYLPNSQQTGLRNSFGTRHKAALGLSENSDAIVLVVSEETGAISLAYNANIYYDLDTEIIKNTLLILLSYRDVLPVELQKGDANEISE